MTVLQDSTLLESLELGPLYEPEAIRFSFQSPAWYFLAVVLFLLAVFISIKWIRNYLKNAYRREALMNLSAIEDGLIEHKETEGLRKALVLLKRVAMQAFGRERVGPLYGNEWLDFLEERGKDTPFQSYASSISDALHRKGEVTKDQVVDLLGLCNKWIETHA